MNEFENYCEKLGDKGINTFSRKVPLPTKRQAIWYKMHLSGRSYPDIGRQSNRTHPTILCGVRRFKGLLISRDKIAVKIWEKLEQMD